VRGRVDMLACTVELTVMSVTIDVVPVLTGQSLLGSVHDVTRLM